MLAGSDRRLPLLSLLAGGLLLVSCTFFNPPAATPVPSPPASPAAQGSPRPATSPSPVAAASPAAAQPPRPAVGGGAAQPRAATTSAPIGGSAIQVIPTPNFAANPTSAPAPLAPAVALQTVQPAAVVQVVGTLSRIPTAIPAPAGGGGGGSSGSASSGGGGGGGGSIPTVGPALTATPPIRTILSPVNIQFPGATGAGGGGTTGR